VQTAVTVVIIYLGLRWARALQTTSNE